MPGYSGLSMMMWKLWLLAFLCSAAAPVAAQTLSASPAPMRSEPVPTASPSPPALQIFGRYVGELAGNTSGGFQKGTAYASEFQIGANYLADPSPIGDSGIIHLILTERWGSSVTQNDIGNVASVQEIYGDALTPRLTELDYEQILSHGQFNVRAGRVIMQNDFAASSTYWNGNLWCNYVSNAICGTPVAAPNNSGYGYYPSSEWGGRVKYSPTKQFYIETGAFQVNPAYAVRGQGFNLGLYGTTGVDTPLEFGFLSYDHSGNYNGSIRVGGYYDTSIVQGSQSDLGKFVASDNPALALIPSQTYRGRSGGWLLFDHLVAGSSVAGARGTAVWSAYEYGDPQTALISNFFDAGIVQHGTFKGRNNDSIALGFYYLDINPRLRTFEQNLQLAGYAVPTTGQEKEVELNYGIAINNQMLLRPNIQYVINPAGELGNNIYPGGAVGIPNALVLGLQAQYNY